jgi:hypothetical protein
VKTHPTLKTPRCRTFRNSAIVFSHPKHSSTAFSFPLTDGISGVLRRTSINGAPTDYPDASERGTQPSLPKPLGMQMKQLRM